jgi:alkylation response protein AidB-like acyl-CoA dehydrogenase
VTELAGAIDPRTLGARERAFRESVRAFIAAALPDDLRTKVHTGRPLDRAEETRWHKALHARGWVAPGWPAALGGCDWSPIERYLFDEACVALDAPFLNPFALHRLGPVLCTYGTPEQQRRYLPPILAGDEWWCQGYSEPDAGSDLAALATIARREGDAYVVTGRKIWTTNAHRADRLFALVRTSREERRQAGITFLLVDLRAPGVAIRPIRTIDGRHHFNEVVLDDVRVPIADRVGAEGEGWTISGYLLGFERFQIAEVPQSQRLLAQLRALAPRARPGDALFASRVDALEIELVAHARTTLRYLARFQAAGTIGPEVSMLKIRGAEIRQALAQLTLEALGPAPDAAAPAVAHFFYSRASSVYGGSNEIQRNLLARYVVAS